MKYLITGAAGFIGSRCAELLCQQGHQVIGVDNLNDYYDVNLKHARLANTTKFDYFTFIELDLADRDGVAALFAEHQFDRVIHFIITTAF